MKKAILNNQRFLVAFSQKSKKCISPIIGLSLLVIVSVVAVIGFQNWYQGYSSLNYNEIENKKENGEIQIQYISSDGFVYISNTFLDNKSIKSIKINDVDCEINKVLESGINRINVNSCIESSGSIEISLFTENKIVDKKIYLEEFEKIINTSYTETILADNPIAYWHFSEKPLNPSLPLNGDFSSGTTYWSAGAAPASVSSVSGRLRVSRNSAAYGVHGKSNNFTLDTTKTYQLFFDYITSESTSNQLNAVVPNAGGIYTQTAYGTYNFILNPTVNNTLIEFYCGNSFTCWMDFDNFEIREVAKEVVNNHYGKYLNGVLVNKTSFIQNNFSNTAAEFDGVNDVVIVDDHADFDFGSTQDFTIEVWINTKGSTENQGIIAKRDGVITSNYFLNLNVNNQLGTYLKDSVGTILSYGSSQVLENNKWYHIVVVYDRDNNSTMYIDGVEVATIDMSSIGNINTNDILEIGSGNHILTTSIIKKFKGSLDEVAIYRHILNESRILKHYRVGMMLE